ncbi:MAG: hypothetical protein QF681_02695 [Vicinamibacterales bacterium]|jgi:purine nucleoside phosphorylase|nr:hypothetical protein [Vicinamibacterales bacterium]
MSNGPQVNRRKFFRTVGAVGALGAFGGLRETSRAGTVVAARQELDFDRPAGLGPGAQLDSRFPVSFALPVT